ncbi:zinc finger, CCHC-type containing protein [Tanacetum coccineum]
MCPAEVWFLLPSTGGVIEVSWYLVQSEFLTSHFIDLIWGSDLVYLSRLCRSKMSYHQALDLMRRRDSVTKLTTGRLVNGSSCDRIDMVIKKLDLEPKDIIAEFCGVLRSFLVERIEQGNEWSSLCRPRPGAVTKSPTPSLDGSRWRRFMPATPSPRSENNISSWIWCSVEELLDWIMDLGGSYHITYKRDYLVDCEEYDGGNILLGDGRECRVRGTSKVQVQMRDGSSFVLDNVRYVLELRRNLISLGTLKKEGFTVKMQLGKIKVIKGSLVVLSRTRRVNCVYTLDAQAMTRETLKGRKQLGEYQTRWKIKKSNQHNGLVEETNVTLLAKVRCFMIQSSLSKVFWAEDTTMSTYLVNRSPSSAIGFKTPVDMLGFFGWLASIKQGMIEPVKVKCILLGYRKGIVGNKLWRLDDITSKVVLYRNIGFNESKEYKKTFIGSGVGTGLAQVLQGVEFEVEPQEDHTFKVEPHGNVDHVVVAAVDKIYAHDSLTFNNTVACKLISKWEAGFKNDMDARSDVYVLSNGCRKCNDDINDYYWEYTPGMFIHLFLYIDDMVFSCGYKAEIWATKGLLDKAKGNILGMEIIRDQSGDCDVEKNGKWSCIYAVGSQEYQVVCTRLDMTSADVVVMEHLVKSIKKARILELKRRYLKITILTPDTQYPSKKIRCICVCTSQKTTKETRSIRRIQGRPIRRIQAMEIKYSERYRMLLDIRKRLGHPVYFTV